MFSDKGTPSESKTGTPSSMEDLLKKSVSEMLFLFYLNQKDCYINEVINLVDKYSDGVCNVTYPYAMIYRLENFNYIKESGKRIAEDGRRRQYYCITAEGKEYLDKLIETYRRFNLGITKIFNVGDLDDGKCK